MAEPVAILITCFCFISIVLSCCMVANSIKSDLRSTVDYGLVCLCITLLSAISFGGAVTNLFLVSLI